MAIIHKIMKTFTRPDGDDIVQYEIVDENGRKMVAPNWYEHEEEAFTVGQYIEKDGTLYRFTFAHTAETEWNVSEVAEVSVTGEIKAVQTAIDGKASKTDTALDTTLSRGRKANTTVGTGSFAFGNDVEASGDYSHAEGSGSISTAEAAHAEGSNGMAAGDSSHVEGLFCGTCSEASHAEGTNTLATRKSQHVFGENNVWEYTDGYQYTPMDDPAINEKGEFIEIVGNGDLYEGEYSNARTLDWDGNERLAGDLYVHAEEDGTGGDKVATEDGLEEAATELKSQIDDKADIIRDTVTNVAIASVPDAANNLPLTALRFAVEPIQAGSGDPYPAGGGKNKVPYPFSSPDGTYGGVQFTTTGEKIVASGTTTGSFSYTIGAVTLPAGTYRISVDGTHIGVQFKAKVSGTTVATIGNGTNAGFTLESETEVTFVIERSTTDISIDTHFQCEAGSTATNWSPYANVRPITGRTGANVYVAPTDSPDDPDKQTYPITWQDEAGTVYGGTVDPLTGELTVTHVLLEFDGSNDENWISNGANGYYINVMSDYKAEQTPIANYLVCLTNGAESGLGTWQGRMNALNASMTNFMVKPDMSIYDTVAKWTTYLASNNLQAVLKLATPVTYQIDHVSINTVSPAGQNSIWADCGAVKLLTYPCDTKSYIEKRLSASQTLMELIVTANREDTMKATKAYTTGNLLIVNGTLYRATTSIANGATLTVGTNVTATTVAAELAALA